MKKILVLNCGSSSLKYRLMEAGSEREISGGEAQRVGPKTSKPSRIIYRSDGVAKEQVVEMKGQAEAFCRIMDILKSENNGSPDIIGHRVVHAGDIFRDNVFIDETAIKELKKTLDFAPLHNPSAVSLIEECHRLYPEIPQYAVFDTVYHDTIPEYARTYALPAWISKKYGFKKFGFHGTSHQYIAEEASKLLDEPLDRLNAVSCHLGTGGASICSIVRGKSIDNTMGYTPLPGLVMSTRSGDIDPAVALQMLTLSGGNAEEVEKILYKQSGVLGLSGISGDIRDIISAESADGAGNERAGHTLDLYLWRMRKALGSFLIAAGNPHAVIFTDTVGETSPRVRLAACRGMEFFGVEIDPDKNKSVKKLPCEISTGKSRVKVFVIATNEELAIARIVCGMADKKNMEKDYEHENNNFKAGHIRT